MQRFNEQEKPSASLTGTVASEIVAPGMRNRTLSANEKRAVAAEAARLAEEVRIEAALEVFRAVGDPEERKRMIAAEEAGRAEFIATAGRFDGKVSPILAVAGVILAGILTMLKDFVHFADTPVTMMLLVASALCVLYSVIKSVVTISPTLQVTEPIARWFGFIHLFSPRHVAAPASKEKHGRLYFGHVAQQPDTAASIRAAVAYYQDEIAIFRDTVTQKEANAKICNEKCFDIAMAVRGVLIAILLLFAAGFCFVFRW